MGILLLIWKFKPGEVICGHRIIQKQKQSFKVFGGYKLLCANLPQEFALSKLLTKHESPDNSSFYFKFSSKFKSIRSSFFDKITGKEESLKNNSFISSAATHFAFSADSENDFKIVRPEFNKDGWLDLPDYTVTVVDYSHFIRIDHARYLDMKMYFVNAINRENRCEIFDSSIGATQIEKRSDQQSAQNECCSADIFCNDGGITWMEFDSLQSQVETRYYIFINIHLIHTIFIITPHTTITGR